MTRRGALGVLVLAGLEAHPTYAQNRGMSTRNVKAAPMGKPSGKPFHAHFVNVAQAAGLRSPVI